MHDTCTLMHTIHRYCSYRPPPAISFQVQDPERVPELTHDWRSSADRCVIYESSQDGEHGKCVSVLVRDVEQVLRDILGRPQDNDVSPAHIEQLRRLRVRLAGSSLRHGLHTPTGIPHNSNAQVAGFWPCGGKMVQNYDASKRDPPSLFWYLPCTDVSKMFLKAHLSFLHVHVCGSYGIGPCPSQQHHVSVFSPAWRCLGQA